VARFQVRKRNGKWELVVMAPNARAWEVVDTGLTYKVAMLLATGQVPYGDWPGWGRTLSLKWLSA